MLSDRLKQLTEQPAVADVKRKLDWAFTQEHAPHDHDTRSITATVGARLDSEDDWTQFVIDNGGAIAPGYRVRLVEMRHNTAGWTRGNQGDDAVTRGTWFYRFVVEPVTGATNVDELIKLIGSRKPKQDTSSGAGVFHFLCGDLQLGKIDGDGSSGVISRFEESVVNAVAEYKRLRRSRSVGKVHLAFLGDCGEGNQSQNGRNMWRTELTVTEQYRVFRRLLLLTVDAFAPLVDTVELDVVNGNHDQVQRFQETRADDGHATESAIALADALQMNPAAYGHVKVFVPDRDESYITREVGSSIITMAHGHQWTRGQAWKWWQGQAFNQQAPAAAHFLFHGHEHEFSVNTTRDRMRVCVPTLESESTWWRHKTGDVGKRGSLVLTTFNGEFQDLGIV